MHMRSACRPAALLWNPADHNASRLHRPPELPRPREGHTAVLQWIRKTFGSRSEKWVNNKKNELSVPRASIHANTNIRLVSFRIRIMAALIVFMCFVYLFKPGQQFVSNKTLQCRWKRFLQN